MKKLLLILFLLILLGGLVWFFFLKDKDAPELGELFDEKNSNGETIVISPSVGNDGNVTVNHPEADPSRTPNTEQNAQNNQSPEQPAEVTEEKPAQTPEQQPEAPKPEDNSDPPTENTAEQKPAKAPEKELPEEKYDHSDNEKQKIIGRYIEAEDFYYTMLFQRYDLDGYDVIKRKNADGYETEYHRVLYYDVNSIADLKKHYLEYFTQNFVNNIDFGAYLEADGKLYCAMTGSSADNTVKYTYSVESTDEQNAYVIRTDSHGNGSTKIGAVCIGGSWYFSSVAIK